MGIRKYKMPRFLTWAVMEMLVSFTETENIGEQVCKGGSKEQCVELRVISL